MMDTKVNNIKCFMCDKDIENKDFYIKNAVEFQGQPGYGSDFDDLEYYIELFICDECIHTNINNIKKYKIVRKTTKIYSE